MNISVRMDIARGNILTEADLRSRFCAAFDYLEGVLMPLLGKQKIEVNRVNGLTVVEFFLEAKNDASVFEFFEKALWFLLMMEREKVPHIDITHIKSPDFYFLADYGPLEFATRILQMLWRTDPGKLNQILIPVFLSKS